MTECTIAHVDVSGFLVDQYEILRGGAFGALIAPEHRRGLVVLLCRGMYAWTRAVAAEGRLMHSLNRSTVSDGPVPNVLVHLLANLTVSPIGRTA